MLLRNTFASLAFASLAKSLEDWVIIPYYQFPFTQKILLVYMLDPVKTGRISPNHRSAATGSELHFSASKTLLDPSVPPAAPEPLKEAESNKVEYTEPQICY